MNNRLIILFIGLLLIGYLINHALEFRIRLHSPLLVLTSKVVLGILMVIMPLSLKMKIKYRISISIITVLTLINFIPSLGIWNISLKSYVADNHLRYEEYLTSLNNGIASEIEYIACRDGELQTRPKSESIESTEYLCSALLELDAKEVFIDDSKGKYLFVMYRFIDNGYGLLYSNRELNEDDIYQENINGLEITSAYKVREEWYYVTFT